MKKKMIILTAFIGLPFIGSSNSLPSEQRKTGSMMQEALSPVQVSLQESSAVFYTPSPSRPFLYGTVMTSDGYVLTKASELEEAGFEDYTVRIGTKRYRDPKVLKIDLDWDLALVKIEATDLTPVDLGGSSDLDHGTWVVSNGATERRFRRPRPGIISANKRPIDGGSHAVLGVQFKTDDDEKIIEVTSVTEKSGAEAGGVKEGDVFLEVDDQVIESRDTLVELLGTKEPGEVLKIKVKRGDEEKELEVELMARHKLFGGPTSRNDQLSGGDNLQSARRTNFPMVLQHDTMLSKRTVGGPLFTLDGVFVGMNIAAANRVETFAIPVEELAKAFEEMGEGE